MITRPMAEPSTSATSARFWRSPLRSAECRRIHTTIHVIIPTAIRAMIVSNCSCSFCGRFSSAIRSATATLAHRKSAAATPSPHPAHGVPAAPLGEERGDDPHDQGGLEALAEPDHEGREHLTMVRLALVARQGGAAFSQPGPRPSCW